MGKMSWFDKQCELDNLEAMFKDGELTAKQYIIACKEVRVRDRTASWAAELARALAPSLVPA